MNTPLALTLALVPGVHAWLVGRRLVGFAEDPALPERLQTARRWTTLVFAFVVALLLVGATGAAWWAVPLAVLSSLAGGFPSRRALYGETGTFAELLARTLRLWSALIGAWLLLAVAPAIVHAAHGFEPPVAALLAAVLAAWLFAADRAALAILGVRPFDRPDLEAGFAGVFERAEIARPALFRLPARGGRWANALAVASRRRPSVVFSEGLLDLLDARETTAILGHEVAHLEHWTPRRLALRAAFEIALVAIGVLLVPFLARGLASFGWAVLVVWPVALLFGLAIRTSRHQAHEGESDRRAVELSGDAEGLVSALVKLHAAARLPSRWQREAERAASHPSLANRVRSIREAAGAAPPAAGTLVVRSSEPGRFVVLEPERVSWLDGVPAETAEEPAALREAAGRVRTLAYRELADLHVAAGLASDARLTALDRGGEKWSVPIRRDDVERLQRALDAADPRLAARSSSPWLGPLPGAILGLVVMIGGLLAAPVPASLLAALIATLRTTTPTIAACGVSALATALVLVRDGGLETEHGALGLALLAGGGAAAALLVLARLRREEPIERARGTALPLAALALGTAIVWIVAIAASGMPPSLGSLHRAARTFPGTVTLTLGLAAALALSRRRLGSLAAVLVACLALGSAAVSARAFAARFVGDPFFAAAERLAVTSRRLEPVSVVPLGIGGGDVRIAPDGPRWAIRGPGEETELGEYVAAPFRLAAGESLGETLDAVDVEFVDADRVLALRRSGSSMRLEVLRADALAAPERTIDLGELAATSLELDVRSGRWRVEGMTDDDRTSVLVVGDWRDGTVERVAWPLGAQDDEQSFDHAVPSRSGALVVEMRYDLAAPASWMWLLGSAGVRHTSHLWHLGAAGRRRLADTAFELSCRAVATAADDDPILCFAYDGIDTHLWSIAPETGERRAVGALAGRHFAFPGPADGTVASWHEGTRLFLIDAAGMSVTELAFAVAGRPLGTAFSGSRVGVVHRTESGSVLAVYETPRFVSTRISR